MENSGMGVTAESAAWMILSVAVGVVMLTCCLCQLLNATFHYHAIDDDKRTKRKLRRRVFRHQNSDVDVALQMLRDSVRC
ncbi:hypothetical protein LSAT2_014978 [Lamellibrachia satsuma]|nr:hypothetical protein LSAT2_014978 [Lamellibrachia satsuma]